MVQYGIDRIEEYAHLFQGRRLGMITSASGVTGDFEPSYRKVHRLYGLQALFGPEHGIRGAAAPGEDVAFGVDEATGVPVYSLYGQDSRRLPKEVLEQLDAVIYDIQDLGVRFFTFISTLLYAVEDCAACGKELIVLDRPDPLGGETVEGGLLKEECKSFVGAYPICTRYGLTAGEFATMVNAEKGLGCRLTVIPCRGWRRSQLFAETGNHWMMPSPSIPHFASALVYPATCFIEGTTLSEGRGTAAPFEMIGAPFIRAQELTDKMQALGLPGVAFTPAYFTPSASKHAGEPCEGVMLHVTDARAFLAVETGIRLLEQIELLWPGQTGRITALPPEKPVPFMGLLAGCRDLDENVADADGLLERWRAESREFAARKKAYHLYE